MKQIKSKKYYTYLSEIPIENYIEFQKYISLASCLYTDHIQLIEVLQKAEQTELLKICEDNLKIAVATQERGLDLWLMAFCCLVEGGNIHSDIIEEEFKIYSKKPFKKKPIHESVIEVYKSFKKEIVTNKFQEGFETEVGTMTIGEYDSYIGIRDSLLVGLEREDSKEFYKLVSEYYGIQSAREIESGTPIEIRKTVAFLKKEGYKIKTAFDYYLAIQLVNELSSKKERTDMDS